MKSVEAGEGPWWLSDLVASAQCGETVLIEREGVPVVRLVPVAPSEFDAELQAYKTEDWCAGATKAEWDAMNRQILNDFEESIDREIV